ncbi:MAG: right-handed parallel beta-helix repeat-containing protein [Planctomycetota bacterium]
MGRTDSKTAVVASLLVLMILNTALAAQVVYVDAGAAGANNGSSWSDACNHLQDALVYADSIPAEIWVAEGTYRPDSNSTDPNGSGDRQATFEIVSGVALYGGFPAGGGPWESREPNFHKTILSGDLTPNDAANESYDLWMAPTSAESSYHVVTFIETDANAILDGFTVTGGNANALYPEDCGGGMFCWIASPTIANCAFTGNFASSYGGAIFNYAGSPALTSCTFTDNGSTPWGQWSGGGAVYNEFSYSLLDNCVFEDNWAAYGGGVWNYDGSPTLTNCRFTGNVGNHFGGGMANHSSAPALVQCTFIGGYSRMGGGISNSDSNPEIIDSTLADNSADWQGGGMHNYKSEPNLTNCIIVLNSAGIGAGAIYVSTTSTLTLTNCTLAGNSAPEGSGLAFDSYQMQYPSNLQATNCILWDDPNEILNKDNSALTIRYSDIMGGWSGPNNINADPCFADADNRDFHLSSQVGRWDPNILSWVIDSNTSPCVDAGDPNSDWTWELWPHGRRINMGAYGGTPEASMSPSTAGNPADLNNDDAVNRTDLMLLTDNWLLQEVLLPPDFDRNRIVNLADFAVLADSWLWTQ